jgi:peroxiredoxin Q/BCP
MVKEGDNAPTFELKDHTGELVTLDGLLASGPFVIYFYPADFTPG